MKCNIVISHGLGNQLFMIFTGVCFALDNNMGWNLYWGNWAGRDSYFGRVYDAPRTNKLSGREVHEHDRPWKAENINIHGYLQNLDYFHHRKSEIIRILGLDRRRNDIGRKYGILICDNDICLHFRLGDYKHIGWRLNFDYYIEALKIVEDMSEYRRIIVFFEKEDEEEVNRRIAILGEKFPSFSYRKINTRIIDYEQMFIMSHMKCNIISNGTFAWWGAYLNDGMVIYPKNWILNDGDGRNMFLDDWIGI